MMCLVKFFVFGLAVMVSLLAGAMESLCLDGLWDFRFEKDRTLEDVAKTSAFKANDKMIVPGCWASMSRYYNLQGTGLYRTTVDLKGDVVNAFVVIEGFGLRAKVFVDSRDVGTSVQPWSTVEFATGPLKAGKHEIVIAVDSISNKGKVKMFHDYYDFYPFGGLYQGVSLMLQKSPVALRDVFVRTRDYKTGLVELEAVFEGKDAPENFTASVSFDALAAQKVEFTSRRAKVNVPAFRLWSHNEPNLHTLTVQVPDADAAVTERFGIRQVGTANGRITLNGKSVYIKGVNRHESHYSYGATSPVQQMYEDITLVKDLGGNFIRGSHYPQCRKFLSLCDELGILVWEESLGWGNNPSQFKDPKFCDLQIEAARMMVRRSINHPSVIISGFLNEPQSEYESCKVLIDKLIDTIRAEDSGHLVTFAANRNGSDICHEKTDIISYNTYPGWYGYIPGSGSQEEMRSSIRRCHADVVKYYRGKYKDNRPILCSESGVKADYGVRDPRGKAQMTEDFQAEYTRLMLEEVFANKDLAGIAIWQMTDAKTYTRRTSGITVRSYGVNTGGLFDLYRRPKLSAEAAREVFTSKSEED
ncbi:MAG: hypothetical protein J6S30_00055 [Kiritimatiellae bacterium]|nr:hypothetical protein [Kiritimatiellia bacterium]